MAKTIYLNLEDDVAKVVAQVKREKSAEVVLVFPKKSFLFGDSINLRLLKKQIDMLGKKASILTMDEKGKTFAQEAGFELKFMAKQQKSQSVSDIRRRTTPVPETVATISSGFDPEPVEVPSGPVEEYQMDVEEPVKKKAPVAKPVAPVVIPDPVIAPAPAPTPAKIVSRPKKVVEKVVEKPPVKTVTASKATTPLKTTTKKTVRRPNVRVSDDLKNDFFSGKDIETQENFFVPPDSKEIKPRKRRSYRGLVVGFVALSLIIVLLLVLVVLPSANIIIYAKQQTVARDIDVLANVKSQSVDSNALTIPAVAVNETQTINDTFQVNGKKEVGGKAEGRVALYNLTGSPITLKASTTTLTVNNKSYVFKQDQNLIKALTSAANDSNATVADIIATDGGESFNLPAGTRVEITNQAFGSQPQRLYAKTVTQVIGGTSRFVSVVTKEDLDAAQTALTKKVVDGINANLASNNVKLVDGAYTINVTSFTPSIAKDVEAQSFTAELKINVTGLAFDETGLKNLIRQRLLMSLGANKDLQDISKDSVIYQIKNLDVQNGLMQLAIHYESIAEPRIETKDLQNRLVGKSKQEASDLILSNPDVEKVEITVQPVWQRGLPSFASKLHLEVRETN